MADIMGKKYCFLQLGCIFNHFGLNQEKLISVMSLCDPTVKVAWPSFKMFHFWMFVGVYICITMSVLLYLNTLRRPDNHRLHTVTATGYLD